MNRDAGIPILRTERLTRVIDGRPVVQNVSITVRAGEILAVVGASGAGKSSFLRLLNRLDEPTDGTVYLQGQDYRVVPPRILRRRVGLLMQSSYLFPGTVADNVRFGPQQRGEHLTPEVVDAFLEQVNLAGYATRLVDRLSGGEAQRVALARLLANRPQVLLLDEPTAALDKATEHEVEELLQTILEEQRLACVIVTHDMGQAERLATRAVEMRAGCVTAAGSIGEVLGATSAL